MAGINNISTNEPNLLQIMQLVKNSVMSRLNCHNIGKILEFDAATQTCTVELQQIKQFNGRDYRPAPITQVPLIILGAGGGHITMPNPVGTICLLLFIDRDIDAFLETGEQYTPETTRMHDFTDCVALTTFKTLVNPIQDYDEEAITIWNEGIIDEIKNTSSIKLYPEKIFAQNSAGGQITVSDKINIQNPTQNLATLIQAFVTACEGIVTVNGGALTPDSRQAFTDLKVKFEELLQ